jgi:hypothetical protein
VYPEKHEDVQLGKEALFICTTCGGYRDSTGDEWTVRTKTTMMMSQVWQM